MFAQLTHTCSMLSMQVTSASSPDAAAVPLAAFLPPPL